MLTKYINYLVIFFKRTLYSIILSLFFIYIIEQLLTLIIVMTSSNSRTFYVRLFEMSIYKVTVFITHEKNNVTKSAIIDTIGKYREIKNIAYFVFSMLLFYIFDIVCYINIRKERNERNRKR